MADFIKKMEDKIEDFEIKHDAHVVEDKEKDEARHEEQLKKDKTKLFKDLREAEIKHDEKVIARKEADEVKHEKEILANEKVIEENREK